ncbi:hypothetical protein ACU686_27595 [Yinghuangia aomiensis]
MRGRRHVDPQHRQQQPRVHHRSTAAGAVVLQRRLDLLAVDEFADLSQRDSPTCCSRSWDSVAHPPRSPPDDSRHARASFGPSLELVADALGVALDEVAADGGFATAARTVDIAAGTISAGTVAAQRLAVTGVHNGRPLLRFRATWYCTTELGQEWDVRPTGWRVAVDGDAPLDIDMTFPVPIERMAAVSPAYTANRAVNAVPAVCAATPGIRTTLDLPGITAVLA